MIPVQPADAEAAAVDTAVPVAPLPEPEPEAGETASPAADATPPPDCALALAAHFPALFGPGVVRPLKLRVQADIQQRAPGVFSRKALSLFLHRHTTRTAYLRALVAAPHRYDLDGEPAGDIADEHRAAAADEVQRRLAIVQAKRAAARPPRPARPPQPPRSPRPPVAPPETPPAADGIAIAAAAAAPGSRGPRPPRPGGPGDGTRRRPARPPESPPQARVAPPRSRADAGAEPRGGQERGPERTHETPPPHSQDAADWEARRQRAALLRAYETSTLSRANFCVLKRLDEASLERLLTQARAERSAAPPPTDPPPQRPPWRS